jgi:diacylglycerol kinase family enzyme
VRALVLLNAAAGLRPGTVRAEAATVRELFEAHGVEACVREVPAPALDEVAREAARSQAGVVVVGGGDGTVSAGAAALVDSAKTLGILPLGTLNHFARDLGIPSDLKGAVRTIAAGLVRRVDVGVANGRVFVNNSSIGIYPHAVAFRERSRTERGSRKWVAMGRAAIATLRRFPLARLTLRTDDGAVQVTTPVVFIGNNRYEVRPLSLGRRDALDRGELWVYFARRTSRLGVLRLGLRALAGRLDQRDVQGFGLTEFVVEERRRSLRVAFDGEVFHMTSPIRYRIRPRALGVFVPREAS